MNEREQVKNILDSIHELIQIVTSHENRIQLLIARFNALEENILREELHKEHHGHIH